MGGGAKSCGGATKGIGYRNSPVCLSLFALSFVDFMQPDRGFVDCIPGSVRLYA